MTNPLELAIVENYAVARGARMRGLRGMSGDPQSQRHPASTLDECYAHEDWLFVNGGNLGLQGAVPSNGTLMCLVGYTSGNTGWLRATFSLPDGSTIEAVNPYRPDLPGGAARGGDATLWAPGARSWLTDTSLTGGMIGNGWAVGFGIGALALAAGGVFYWRKRR